MSKIIESAKAEAQYANAPVAKTTNTEKDGIKRRTKDMDKVYLVHTMNLDLFCHSHEYKGFGVFLNYEDAKKCLDQNLKELIDLYKKVYNTSRVEVTEVKVNDNEGYRVCYYGNDFCHSDVIDIHTCEIGKWNDGERIIKEE